MHIIAVFNRSQLVDQILSNLATAGVIEQHEMDKVREELEPVDSDSLIALLLESHQMREDTGNADAVPIVPIGQISLN